MEKILQVLCTAIDSGRLVKIIFAGLFLLDPESTIRFVKIGYSPLLAEELELAVRQILHDRPIQAQKNK